MTPIDVNALPASPWKNGGGSTRTIAISPPGATFDNFDWRISIADVASSGDFSRFPGVDRTILLLSGAGMILHLDDGNEHPLTTPFEHYAFRGDDAVRSALVDGSTRDFNVMTRRHRAQAEVTIVETATRMSEQPDAAVFFCPRGAFKIAAVDLNSGWALRVDRPSGFDLVPQTPNAVIISVLLKQL